MKKYQITGQRRLKGSLKLHGAKNATLPILAATALTDEEVILNNVPIDLNDVKVMISILKALGKKIIYEGDRLILAGPLKTHIVPPELGNRIRYSLLFMGVLLNRLGKSSVPNPGGCSIGDRKFDLHISGLEQLGAKFDINEKTIESTRDQMVGTDINFYLPTTSGTQNVIIGALAAQGETILKNANTRPENLDFVMFLRSMGADVEIGNRVAWIRESSPLHGTEYTIMNGPDELVSYIIAAAITGGEIRIENADLMYAPTDIKVLREAGVEIFEWGGSVYVSAPNSLKPIDIFTTPYPGINSDMQPLYSVLASMAEGESTVTDMRFTERFQYVDELAKFGVTITAYGNCAVIQGGSPLNGCEARATDLRGGTALVLAGLVSEGITTIDNVYQIERGYINLPDTLRQLGADIKVIDFD